MSPRRQTKAPEVPRWINLAKDLTDKLNEMQAAVLSSNHPPRKE